MSDNTAGHLMAGTRVVGDARAVGAVEHLTVAHPADHSRRILGGHVDCATLHPQVLHCRIFDYAEEPGRLRGAVDRGDFEVLNAVAAAVIDAGERLREASDPLLSG